MEEFPNNSHKAKQGEPTDVEQQIEKIIEGEVTVRKPSGWRRFKQSFIAGDATSVGEHVFWNLMIPSAKDALSDMASTFIDMMIYGEKRNRLGGGSPNTGFGSTSRINYGGISTGRVAVNPNQMNPAIEQFRPRFSPNEIIVPTRAQAEGVIGRMFEILEKYQAVTVANLYSLVGVSAEYTDSKFGWTNLDSADVKRVREGVLLVLPPPQDLS